MALVSSLPIDFALGQECCPICLDSLSASMSLTQRECTHIVCTACFEAGEKTSGYQDNVCPVCRATPCTKTRAGSTLTQSFSASKRLATPTTTKKKSGPRGGNPPRLSGPSAGSRAVSAGSKSRGQGHAKRLAKRKANVQAERESADEGGFTSASRGKVRRLGIKVPVGSQNTCLPDACWVGAHDAKPDLELKLSDVRAALATSDGSDPTVSMAKSFLEQHGLTLHYVREINNPKALFNRRASTFLLRLAIKTETATDYHFVAYLASSGFLVDNCPGQPVLKVDDTDRRASNKNAMRLFKKLFPGAAQIEMASVYEFQMCCQISRSIMVIEPATTRSRPPTHEDLFIALYQDGTITSAELNEILAPLELN